MNRIKQLREEHGYTQQELADKLNKAKSTIAMYESDARKPSYKMLKQLANIFNCSIDYIMCTSNDTKDIFISAYDSEEIDEEDKQLLLNLYNKLKKKR